MAFAASAGAHTTGIARGKDGRKKRTSAPSRPMGRQMRGAAGRPSGAGSPSGRPAEGERRPRTVLGGDMRVAQPEEAG